MRLKKERQNGPLIGYTVAAEKPEGGEKKKAPAIRPKKKRHRVLQRYDPRKEREKKRRGPQQEWSSIREGRPITLSGRIKERSRV